MFKILLLATLMGICVAKPTGLGGYGYGGHGALGIGAYGAGAYGAALVPSSGLSTPSRIDVHGPAVAYSAGAPYPGAITLPHGINAGVSHVSVAAIPTPVFGTVAYGGHGYGAYGGHALGGHY